MLLRYGDMWACYADVDLFLITGNSFVKGNGAVAMGRGIARVARDKFKGVDKDFGKRINHLGYYGVLLHEGYPANKLGLFQVKRHFAKGASLRLIASAVDDLCGVIDALGLGAIALNYPGIGYGHLCPQDVLTIIQRLPDNVHVWRYAK